MGIYSNGDWHKSFPEGRQRVVVGRDAVEKGGAGGGVRRYLALISIGVWVYFIPSRQPDAPPRIKGPHMCPLAGY